MRPGEGSREPTPIGEVLAAVLEQAARGMNLRAGSLFSAWRDIAGERWAAVRPVVLRDGVLVVEVRSGPEAALLRYEVPALVRRIGERLGSDLVHAVHVRVARDGWEEGKG